MTQPTWTYTSLHKIIRRHYKSSQQVKVSPGKRTWLRLPKSPKRGSPDYGSNARLVIDDLWINLSLDYMDKKFHIYVLTHEEKLEEQGRGIRRAQGNWSRTPPRLARGYHITIGSLNEAFALFAGNAKKLKERMIAEAI